MKKIFQSSFFACLIIVALFSSCVSQKEIAYFQKGINQSDTLSVAKTYIPKIQAGDILDIKVGSLNAAASSFFNPYAAMPAPTGSSNDGAATSTLALSQTSAPGFLVDPNGFVDYPLIGSVKLADLTTPEAKEKIKGLLQKYLKEPTVNVRVMNYKISVMGEVAKPSVYLIPNEKITLPEALSLAGDLTIFGKRDNVLIIRDENGKKEFGRINLNSRDLYSSPYYYLHNNDVVYIEPGKGKVAQTDKTYQILPIMLSALSLITILIQYSK
jgi:polysaccharide export outer membrane protein